MKKILLAGGAILLALTGCGANGAVSVSTPGSSGPQSAATSYSSRDIPVDKLAELQAENPDLSPTDLNFLWHLSHSAAADDVVNLRVSPLISLAHQACAELAGGKPMPDLLTEYINAGLRPMTAAIVLNATVNVYCPQTIAEDQTPDGPETDS